MPNITDPVPNAITDILPLTNVIADSANKAPKATGKQGEKLGQLLAETGNLLQRHPDDPP